MDARGLLVVFLHALIQAPLQDAQAGHHAQELQLAPDLAIIVEPQLMGLLDDRVRDQHLASQRAGLDHLEEKGQPLRALLARDQARLLGCQVLGQPLRDGLDQGLIAGPILDGQLVPGALRDMLDQDIAVLLHPPDAGGHEEIPRHPRLIEDRGRRHQLVQLLPRLPGGERAVVGADLQFLRGGRGRRFHGALRLPLRSPLSNPRPRLSLPLLPLTTREPRCPR